MKAISMIIQGTADNSNGAGGGQQPGGGAPPNVWEDNWDDETVETPFHVQLAEELKKRGHKQ